jgi:hypothetical protein
MGNTTVNKMPSVSKPITAMTSKIFARLQGDFFIQENVVSAVPQRVAIPQAT